MPRPGGRFLHPGPPTGAGLNTFRVDTSTNQSIINMTILRQTIFTIFCCLWAAAAPAAEAFTAEDEVRALLESIKQIQSGDALTPEQIKKNEENSGKALTRMAMDEVSRKALGKYWDKTPPEDQKKFSNLLSQLFVHVAFPSSAKFFSGLKLEFSKAVIEETRAVVPMVVTHSQEGEVGIEFHMAKFGDAWRVVDVYLDDVSMRNNLRNQFYKVLSQNDFNDLLQRMEKKLSEART